jgi:hypothetical protein
MNRTTATISSSQKPSRLYMDSYQQSRQQIPLLAQPAAMLGQREELRAWITLKRREQALESKDEFRAAFNLYSDALTFDANQYVLTAPKEVRKELIRQDRLRILKM